MYANSQKSGKPNILKVFGSKKTKGPKQDTHTCHMCISSSFYRN